MIAKEPSAERSFQMTQDSVGFAHPNRYDVIRACSRIAVGVDAQLRCVSRRADVRDVAIAKMDPHAVEHINLHDVVESERGGEETR